MNHDPLSSDPEDLHDEIDLEQYAQRGEKPPSALRYVIRIDDQKFRVTSSTITAHEILALAGGLAPGSHTAEQVHRGDKRSVICPLERVDLTQPGIERFVTRVGVAFFIDQEQVFAPTATLTVREILEDYAKVDATKTTLVEMHGDDRVKHPDLNERLTVNVCERFVVFHNTPTTVS